jgi:hypothetical protein
MQLKFIEAAASPWYGLRPSLVRSTPRLRPLTIVGYAKSIQLQGSTNHRGGIQAIGWNTSINSHRHKISRCLIFS